MFQHLHERRAAGIERSFQSFTQLYKFFFSCDQLEWPPKYFCSKIQEHVTYNILSVKYSAAII